MFGSVKCVVNKPFQGYLPGAIIYPTAMHRQLLVDQGLVTEVRRGRKKQ